MIAFRNFALRRGERLLLSDVDLALHAGWRVGVVGRNGTGKSSLFAAIRGEVEADRGDVDVPGRVRIASVAQETPSLPDAAIEFVLGGDDVVAAVIKAEADANAREDWEAVAEAHQRLRSAERFHPIEGSCDPFHALLINETPAIIFPEREQLPAGDRIILHQFLRERIIGMIEQELGERIHREVACTQFVDAAPGIGHTRVIGEFLDELLVFRLAAAVGAHMGRDPRDTRRPDGRADEGVSAGPASLQGTLLAKKMGWTAPGSSTGASDGAAQDTQQPEATPAGQAGGLDRGRPSSADAPSNQPDEKPGDGQIGDGLPAGESTKEEER